MQSTDADVDVGSLCRHRQARGYCASFRRLVVGKRCLPSAAQTAEYVDFPARTKIGFVSIAVTIETGCRIQGPPQGGFGGLVGSGRLSADIAGRQQRGVSRTKSGACLGNAGGCPREIKVLFERKHYEPGQLRIIEARPPCGEVGAGSRVPHIHGGLALESHWQGGIGPDVIGADSAAC